MDIMERVRQIAGGSKGTPKPVQCTSVGDEKLQKIQVQGADYIILSIIKAHEPCTLDEVARDPKAQKFSVNDIREIMISMLDRGWIMYAPIGGK